MCMWQINILNRKYCNSLFILFILFIYDENVQLFAKSTSTGYLVVLLTKLTQLDSTTRNKNPSYSDANVSRADVAT